MRPFLMVLLEWDADQKTTCRIGNLWSMAYLVEESWKTLHKWGCAFDHRSHQEGQWSGITG